MENANDTPTSDASPVDQIITFEEHDELPRQKKLVAIEVFGYQIGCGKNKRIVNPDDVYKLAALGCTNQEIMTWFDIHNKDTLVNNFHEVLNKGREELKIRLRRAQLDLAINGKNPTMLIWLGKQMLGQTDQPVNTEATAPLPFNDEGL